MGLAGDDPLDLAEEQRRVTKLALDTLAADDFALAGSGAIREHGLIDRPTQDVDLFTVQSAVERFLPALDRMIQRFEQAGFRVSTTRRQPGFAQLQITTPTRIEIGLDLGIDWRAEPPGHLDVGPVLAIDDAVGNKVAALFSRGEVRDYLDVDSIRQSQRYRDEDLYRLAHRADAGFTLDHFAERLDRVTRFEPSEVADYRVTPDQLAAVKTRMSAWATDVRSRAGHNPRPVRDGHHTPTPGAGG